MIGPQPLVSQVARAGFLRLANEFQGLQQRLMAQDRLQEADGTGTDKTLGIKGIATRSKDATRGSWPYY